MRWGKKKKKSEAFFFLKVLLHHCTCAMHPWKMVTRSANQNQTLSFTNSCVHRGVAIGATNLFFISAGRAGQKRKVDKNSSGDSSQLEEGAEAEESQQEKVEISSESVPGLTFLALSNLDKFTKGLLFVFVFALLICTCPGPGGHRQ